jgi:RNA polymerase sigma factor (sigma-70 family)
MARETRNAVLLSEVRTMFGFGVVRDSSDRQLLERFLAADRVEAEAAFTFLVKRHGPMVLHVCRQVLDDADDAQDAFQATFLVFLHRAAAIRKRDSLASWLFGVATRVARRARYAAIVRRVHERQAGEVAAAAVPSSNGDFARLAALHDEVARLPDRYREPIVLCHLEGLSTAAAAQRLGCPQGTILSRLARGRQRLRRRLVQRGQAESGGLLVATSMPPEPLTALSAALVNSTVQYAVPASSGRAILAATISPSVAVLTHATLRTFFMTRILLAAAVLGTGAAMTVATIPIFRPSVRAGSHAPFMDEGTEQHQQKSPTIEQRLLHSRDLEDALYKILERDREFNDPRWPFVIKVRDVQERSLIDATFKHRLQGKVNEYDAIIQARRAVLRFDMGAKVVRIFLEHVEVQHFRRDADVVLINNDTLVMPIPPTDLLMPLRTSPALAEVTSQGQNVMMDSDQALSLDYSRDGKTLATAGFDGVVHLWDMIQAKEVARLNGEKSTIRSVSFAPDGKTVACVNDAGFVKLWDATTGTLKQTLPGLSESMRQAAGSIMLDAISFSPDGHLLAVSGFGPVNAELSDRIYELRIFDVRAGQPKWSHIGRGEQACSLAFAPDGETLARAGWKTVTLWNAKDGEPIRTLYPTKGTIFALTFTPDGRTLVGGGNIRTPDVNHRAGLVTLWNVATGRITRALEGHRGGVHAVAIAPVGNTVASGGDGPRRPFGGSPSEVRLWDAADGKLLWTVEGESGIVRGLAFAPDGKTLVYCDDAVVGVIEVETGKLKRTLTKTTLTPRMP